MLGSVQTISGACRSSAQLGHPGRREGSVFSSQQVQVLGQWGTCVLGSLPRVLSCCACMGTPGTAPGPWFPLPNLSCPGSLTPSPPPWLPRSDWIHPHTHVFHSPRQTIPLPPNLLQPLALGPPGNSIPSLLGQSQPNPSQCPPGWVGTPLGRAGVLSPPHPRPALSCGVIPEPHTTH